MLLCLAVKAAVGTAGNEKSLVLSLPFLSVQLHHNSISVVRRLQSRTASNGPELAQGGQVRTN